MTFVLVVGEIEEVVLLRLLLILGRRPYRWQISCGRATVFLFFLVFFHALSTLFEICETLETRTR